MIMAQGRKFIPIDWKRVEKLITSGCSGVQVAAILGIDTDTLYNRCKSEFGVYFSAYSAPFKEICNSLLQQKQVEVALKGNTTMLVWLGKNRLDQKDDPKSHEEFDSKLKGYIDHLKSQYIDQKEDD
jgi:hypothetical protein